MQRLLKHSRYNPGRGGHAPGDLREAFGEAVAALEKWRPSNVLPTVEVRDQVVPIDVVFRLLWNCDDILPNELANDVVELPSSGEPLRLQRRTYGAASRLLLALCERQANVRA